MMYDLILKNKGFSKIKRSVGSAMCASTIFFATACSGKAVPGPDNQALYYECAAFKQGLIPKSSTTYERFIDGIKRNDVLELVKKEGKANFRGEYNGWGFKQEAIEAGFCIVSGGIYIKLGSAKPANTPLRDTDLLILNESGKFVWKKYSEYKSSLGSNNDDFLFLATKLD